jgi:nitroreductase
MRIETFGGINMFENITSDHSDALNEILKTHHSVRVFSPNPPSRREIDQIIRSGLIAPFASLPAKGRTDFRKIIVIPANSIAMNKVLMSVNRVMPKFADELKEIARGEPSPNRFSGPNFDASRFGHLLGNAPYLIIAAERKGLPPTYMADQSISISYCMYNMWLTAVSLRIGFRLISIFVHLKMGNDAEFCKILSIPPTEFALDACAVGYPAENYQPTHVNYPDYRSNVTWLD